MRNAARTGAWATCVCVLVSAAVTFVIAATLPAPWVSQDIGAVGLAGSASYSNGVFAVQGAGADIWGTADAFQSVMQPITGDVQIVARVASIQNTDTYAKAGVMLRDALTPSAAHVILDVRPDGSIEFMTRAADGASTSYLAGATQAARAWLKLTRAGNIVTGFVSADGTTWTQVGSTTLSVPSAAYIGLVVTSHTVSQLNTSTFDNVAISGSSTLPSPWQNADVGVVGLAGSASYSNGVFTVQGAGADIWGTADAFHAVEQTLAGDVQLIARVASMQNTNTYAKAGVMLRDSTAANASHVILDVRPTGDIEFMTRSVTGGSTTWLSGAVNVAPVWLKLTRVSTTVTAYFSSDGASWTQVGTTTLTFGASPLAALIVTSHDVTQLNAATFDNVAAGPLAAISPPPTPISPSPTSGASGQSPGAIPLSWISNGATSYDLRFGTANPPPSVSTGLTTPSYVVSRLNQATTYYWQVVARNSGGSATSAVWSFTTAGPPPTPPTSPSPPSGATGVSASGVSLSWSGSAASYDLSFGVVDPPPGLAAGLTTPSYAIGSLQPGTTYYWQVVARTGSGSASSSVWSFTTAAVQTTSAPSQYSAITDRIARAKPPVPALGPAGYAFDDPTFGSKMLRVTDGLTRPGVVNRSFRVMSNAHLAAWNTTSTAFVVVSNDGTQIPFKFDPATMSVSRFPSTVQDGNGGLTLAFYVESQFSLVNPDVIYGGGGSNNRTILSYSFSSGTYTPIVDLDTVVSGLANTYIGSLMTGGTPNETLLTIFGGASQDLHYYALVQPLTGGPSKLLNTVASTINGVATNTVLNFHIHAMQIDKSGRYVFIYPTGPDLAAPRDASQVYLWDTTTDTITAITSSMHPAGHDAAGFGYWINQDCCTSSSWDAAQWQFRSLATPAQTSDLISPVLTPEEIYLADHTTWNNAQPDRLVPVISATYRYGTNTAAWRAWDDEIIAIDTANGDGATVWRFAHHRSNVGSDADPSQPYFWYEPMANISPDGRWVLFTSNWEKTLGTDSSEGTARQDVFLLQLTASQ
ncbi:MAG TPA: hypothetical protein VLV86_03980 [Vicinamibacterales bacterium]|nr:hypothetical protein [Vicinamibacterales bacterium]